MTLFTLQLDEFTDLLKSSIAENVVGKLKGIMTEQSRLLSVISHTKLKLQFFFNKYSRLSYVIIIVVIMIDWSNDWLIYSLKWTWFSYEKSKCVELNFKLTWDRCSMCCNNEHSSFLELFLRLFKEKIVNYNFFLDRSFLKLYIGISTFCFRHFKFYYTVTS